MNIQESISTLKKETDELNKNTKELCNKLQQIKDYLAAKEKQS